MTTSHLRFRFPKTFETGFFIFLIAFWLVSFLAERSSLGRIILGYRSELYPMSTFAVYTGPKQQQVSVFAFDVVRHQGNPPVTLSAYDMFYPLQAPNLDDEIATRQLFSIVSSFNNHCVSEQTTRFGNCAKHPAKTFALPQDINTMWLHSIAHHLHDDTLPESIAFKQTSYLFDPNSFQVTRRIERPLMLFHPRRDAQNSRGWIAERTDSKNNALKNANDDS